VSAALECVAVEKRYDGVHAVRGVSLRVEAGRVVGLIGPNGSGKTTLLGCLSGALRPSAGNVLVNGRDLTGAPAHVVARAGVVRTFQNIRLFRRLTCLRNVEASALAAGRVRRGDAKRVARTELRELGLGGREERFAESLSYGEQRRLEIARALAARPRVLLLDEPAAGMNERESAELARTIERVRSERGCGVLVVEHDLGLIMRTCDEVYVLEDGELISHGTPAEVRADPAVVTAYIGEEAEPGEGAAGRHEEET
jgi:ABC-type branched-subunit amino acid transport system ATPase component